MITYQWHFHPGSCWSRDSKTPAGPELSVSKLQQFFEFTGGASELSPVAPPNTTLSGKSDQPLCGILWQPSLEFGIRWQDLSRRFNASICKGVSYLAAPASDAVAIGCFYCGYFGVSEKLSNSQLSMGVSYLAAPSAADLAIGCFCCVYFRGLRKKYSALGGVYQLLI